MSETPAERPNSEHGARVASLRQFAWFDCLRCAAVFLVILAHAGSLSSIVPGSGAAFAEGVQKASWVGVDLFFVLSGFLVSGLLFAEHDRTGRLEITRFLIRRAFKIVPPFYVLILFTVIYDGAVLRHVNVDHLWHDLFFLQSYRAGAWPHAWTLAIEVHFYLLLALLLYGLSRSASAGAAWLRRLPWIIGGVLLACFLARLINSEMKRRAFNYHHDFEPSHLHLDVLAAGVLLRYLYNYHPERLAIFRWPKLLWIGLGLLLIYPSRFLWLPHSPMLTAFIPTGNYLGFGLILFEATQIRYPSQGIWRGVMRPFDYLGKHSYSIYLWHLPVKDWLVDPFLKQRAGLELCAFYQGSLVVGVFFSVMLEMPMLRLRDRLFPSASSARPSPESRSSRSSPPATKLA
jgi:peptidoglycan/LPS O-acetylase OafA/YrhL